MLTCLKKTLLSFKLQTPIKTLDGTDAAPQKPPRKFSNQVPEEEAIEVVQVEATQATPNKETPIILRKKEPEALEGPKPKRRRRSFLDRMSDLFGCTSNKSQ